MIVIKNARVRRILRLVIPAVLIPACALYGVFCSGDGHLAAAILLCVLLSLLLFYTGFEQRRCGTRRLVLVGVLTALSVVGRMIPLLKPVTALTILGGMYLGAESGFLIGSLSCVLSNFFFGQGPWTPFQMLAWGLIGLVAGLLSRPLCRSRLLLLLFGLLSGVAFSMGMDVFTVLWYHGSFSLPLYLAALATALPHTALYACSNVLFLLLFAPSFGKKFARIKLKYGI